MSFRRFAGRGKSILPAGAGIIATALLMAPTAAGAAPVGNVWSVVKSPNVTAGTFATNALLSVSAVSDTNVWAAGFANKSGADDSTDAPLIEHWNGTAWSVSPVGTQNAMLTSISADSATDAWAVGNVLNTQTLLAEHWTGSAWSTVAMPLPAGTLSARIEGVTALSPTNAWAVGVSVNNDLGLPLIEHWDGTGWSVTPNVPRQVSDFNDLHGVTAISANDIWAVGEFDQGGASPQSQLLMHWNGTNWSLSRPAQVNTGESNAFPAAVSGAASNDVWAVGGVDITGADQSRSQQPFAMHWDGTAWTDIATPAAGTLSAAFAFTSVAALSRNDVWAVGLNGGRAFIEHWDGTNWSAAGQPALGANGNTLEGITKSGTNSLWAVGDNNPASVLKSQTLTLHTTAG